MSPLRAPIRDVLRRPVDEVAARRLWQRVRDGRRPRARQRPWLLAAAAAIALLVAVVVVGRGGWGGEGPLALDADRMVLEVDAGRAPLRVEASDGSVITVAPSSRVEVVENTDRTFGTLVSRGRARFEVQPGGPRRWTVDCGAFVVEVVGTAFVVERDATTARVAVERGEVVVRGEAVPGRWVRLVAGKEIAVTAGADARSRATGEPRPDAADADAADGVDPPTPVAPGAVDPTPVAPRPTTVPSAPSSPTAVDGGSPGAASPGASASAGASAAPVPAPDRWRDLAREGRHRDAWAALGTDGFRRATGGASVDELLALADVARLSGHPAEAVAPLERVLREHGGDGRASLAALTLGRLQLDALGQPAAAVASLNRAIAAGLPGGLAEDALARRVEAYARAGDRDAAMAAYAELARRFPSSPRLDAARRWTEPPP